MRIFLSIVIASIALTLFGAGVPEDEKALKLSPVQAQALVIAAQALAGRTDYNNEQKALSNYEVRIYNTEGGIVVSFIAIPRKGDEATFGGNFEYARSVKYVVDERTFQILKVVGSK
jgi:hypothetical protein